MGATSTKSGRLEVNLSLSEKRGGKRHLGTFYFQLFQESGPLLPPPLSLLLLRCILCLVFVVLFKLSFIASQCSLVASWCTLCVGTPKFSRGVMHGVPIVDCAPDSKKYNMKSDLVVSRDASEAPCS